MENNDSSLKQRLVGAAVLISLVVVFLPMLVDDGPGPHPDRPAVPPAPEWNFSGWKGEEYQAPEPPERSQRPVAEVVEPGATGANTAPQDAQGQQGVAHAGQENAGQSPGDSANNQTDSIGNAATTDSQNTVAQDDGPRKDVLEATVKSGDTLYGIFRRLGLEPSQVREVVNVSGAREPLSRLRPGQRLRIRVDGQKRILAMEYLHSGGSPLRIKRIGGQLQQVTGGQQASAAPRSAQQTAAVPPGNEASGQSPASASKTPAPSREQGPVAWAVQIGVYKDWNAARKVQASLRSEGYPAFLKSQGKDSSRRWQLKVGPQLKKSDAVALARKIQQQNGGKTQVVAYP